MGLTSLEDNIKYKKRNNSHLMLVDGMSTLMTKSAKNCQSMDFHAFGLKWKFSIHVDLVKDYLSAFLTIADEKCTGSNWRVTCSFKLSVVSQTGALDICTESVFSFDSNNVSWGVIKLISQEMLKQNFIVNDKAVFCAEITGVTALFLNVIINTFSPTMGTAERVKLMKVSRNNSRFTWKITQFSSFSGESHSSYEFTCGPRRWYLEMYPKGYLEGKGNSLSLFLHASDFVSKAPVEAISAIYKLRVLDQHKRNHHEIDASHRFTSINTRWGFNKFLELEELHKASNGFLVNDAIYIGVEFKFMSTHNIKYMKRNNSHFMLVDGMSTLMTENVKNCESMDFRACGLKWKFTIRFDPVKDYLSAFLTMGDEKFPGSKWAIWCRFELSVVSQTGAINIRIDSMFTFNSTNASSEVISLISQEMLKQKFIVNDKAVFCAEIIGVIQIFPKDVINRFGPAMGTAERVKPIKVSRNNSRFTWKITQFSSFSGESHSSYEFTCGPRRWYLEMYPKGYLKGKGNSLSLFLHASDFVSKAPVEATSAIYKLRVLNQHKRNHHEINTAHRFTSNTRWGFDKFLELEKLHKASNGFLVNDAIYIGVEFLSMATREYL
ncbi:hypothetical protein F2Q70_00025237 [Brassica cretica]|uniref:MATH domain-containing protein n=1 Tax=Brassica cretica TaxID=69181 RepID=A0A8S9L0T1_BRACR|nr:hypothetical protein F2Q70_00025237 [Brassica cretica]